MRRNIIYICTEDILYGERLLQYIIKKGNAEVEFGLLTNYKNWRKFGEHQNIIGLLVEEDTGPVKGPPDFHGTVILLKAKWEANRLSHINKYQSAELIYKEILEKFQISDARPKQSIEEKVVAIFNPQRGNEGLNYIKKDRKQIGKGQKVVYLCLTALPPCLDTGVSFELPSFGSLSDLIISLDDENFDEKLKGEIYSIDSLDVIPPVRHYKDLLDIRKEELHLLLSLLQKKCGYQTCYIECSELYEFTFPLFSFADHIVIIDSLEMGRKDRINRYMEMDGLECLKEKIIWINEKVPEDTVAEGEDVIFDGQGGNEGVGQGACSGESAFW